MPKTKPSEVIYQHDLFGPAVEVQSSKKPRPQTMAAVKRKKTTIIYTQTLTSDTPMTPTDRVPARKARDWFGVKRMRVGLVYERPSSYGGKWIAVCVGVNPEKRSENLWDILYQQAS